MIYGEEKAFHMIRSVLPSRKRRWARWEKARISRKYRRELKRDFYNTPPKHMREYIKERRDADKLAHFEKWAIEITWHLPDSRSRLAFMKGKLPEGLIGTHAVSHLRNYRRFEINEFRNDSVSNRRYVMPKPPEKDYPTVLYNILCSPGGHRALNEYMVKSHVTVKWPTGRKTRAGDEIYELKGPTRPRLLRGIGDIETFLVDLKKATKKPTVTVPEFTERVIRKAGGFVFSKSHTYVKETKSTTRTNPHFHPEWERAMKEFVNNWKG